MTNSNFSVILQVHGSMTGQADDDNIQTIRFEWPGTPSTSTIEVSLPVVDEATLGSQNLILDDVVYPASQHSHNSQDNDGGGVNVENVTLHNVEVPVTAQVEGARRNMTNDQIMMFDPADGEPHKAHGTRRRMVTNQDLFVAQIQALKAKTEFYKTSYIAFAERHEQEAEKCNLEMIRCIAETEREEAETLKAMAQADKFKAEAAFYREDTENKAIDSHYKRLMVRKLEQEMGFAVQDNGHVHSME